MKSLVAALAALCLLSCKSATPSIVGTWHSYRQGADTEWHFFPDGKLLTMVNYRGTVVRASGTYTIKDGVLSMANTDVQELAPTPDSDQVRQKLMERGAIAVKFNSPFNVTGTIPDSNEPLILGQINPNP